MSSESSIYIGAMPIKGEVVTLNPELASTVVRIKVNDGDHKLVLYIKDDRLLEACLLFHKIAQDLAALLPDVDACCRCVPGTPDDQCALHGYGAFKIKAAASCPLCDKPSPGGEVYQECADYEQTQANAEAERERAEPDTIPREEAGEHVEPPHRWG